MRAPALLTAPATSVRRDLRPVHVRRIRESDRARLVRLYGGLSNESRRARFLSSGTGPSAVECTSFCAIDHNHREGFVAVVRGRHGTEEIVGHISLEQAGQDVFEIAIAIADAWQAHGLGRRLMAAALAWARAEKVTHLTATMLVTNAPIHRLLVGVGMPTRTRDLGAGVEEVDIDIVADGVAA
jgi:acetyltransferase